MAKAALVVTTYNNPEYLGLCLKSVTAQSTREFDLFIADDGSGPETREKIDAFRNLYGRDIFAGRRIEHRWHPDSGYNKSAINNSVFAELKNYPIVICIDHDVIVHPRFVEDHLDAHEGRRRACFMGRRVDLGPGISHRITEDNVLGFCRGLRPSLLVSGLLGDSSNISRAIRLHSPGLRSVLKRDQVPDLLGSNFSVSTELLFSVNGYNEDYKSYWGEDGDLFVRLRNAGADFVGSRALAIQFHLYHPRLTPTPEHQKRYQELLKDTAYKRCSNGISKE